MGAVAFISGTQHIKTVAAQTDSQSHYLTLQNVVTVCRAMGRFVPLAVCLFKGGYVSWVQLYMSLDSISSVFPDVVSEGLWRCWTCIKLAIGIRECLTSSPIKHIHKGDVIWCLCPSSCEVGSSVISIFQRASWVQGAQWPYRGLSGVSHTRVNNVCAEWADSIIPFCCGINFTNTASPVQKHGYASFSLRAKPLLRTGFNT